MSLSRFAPYTHSTRVLSVRELALYVDGILESDDLLRDVWLRGEVVNVSRSTAGHYYFNLKDGAATLRCVLFRGSAFNSPVKPANGLALVAHGAVRLYERHGACELVADLLFPEGVGVAQMQAEMVRQRLTHEGLFDAARKRPLPPLPRSIGVISSEHGAVIHDLLSVLARRFPLAEVVFLPCPVQGAGAAAALVRALQRLAGWRRDARGVDVIVLARGGGSDEDLAAFDDERLARAVFACPVPVVSAVGHEQDTPLCDFAADARASTPTAAARLVVPDLAELLEHLARARLGLDRGVRQVVARHRQRLVLAHERLARAPTLLLERRRSRLLQSAGRLRALSPQATLERGYAIVRAQGKILRSAVGVKPRDRVEVELAEGGFAARVEDTASPKDARRRANRHG